MAFLKTIISAVPIFQQVMPFDSAIAVVDSEGRTVAFSPAKTFVMNQQVGQRVSEGGAVAECLRTRREVKKIIPKEVYGVTVKATSIPIIEGVLIGVLSVAISIETQQILHNSSKTIAEMSRQLAATAEKLTSRSFELSDNLGDTKGKGEIVLSHIKKTDNILKLVRDIAINSKLLGVNAAIEAARAGNYGLGFSVVAKEIGDMAITSSNAVNEINEILQRIENDTVSMIEEIDKVVLQGGDQTIVSQEILAVIQELVSSSIEIENISQIL